MKMKKLFVTITALALVTTISVSCKRKKENVAPEPDTETQSGVDAAWATFVVTDIEQQCACMSEDLHAKSFYSPTPESYDPATATGSILPTHNLPNKFYSWAYNNTKCLDGNRRDGSIFVRYGPDPQYNPNSNPNSIYYRDYGFVGRVTLSSYKMNGWLIETESYLGVPGGPAIIYNLVERDDYDPAITKLKWRIVGRFILHHPTDPTKDMIWDGDIIKTLTNSTDRRVFNATRTNKNTAITWSLGVVSYEGTVKGTTEGNVAYTATLSSTNPLVRDFTCYSDKVAGVALAGASVDIRPLEFHPITQGIMSFKTGDKYVRQIYFGNEGNPDSPGQCDNSGEVLIKGLTYKIDFRKQ